jgi:hypothetical protein
MSTRLPLAIECHDPNAGLSGPWTIEFELDPGWTLIGPVTVIAVHTDGTDAPLVGDSLVTSNITLGQVSDSPNVGGISFDLNAGSPQVYWLRGAAQRTDGTHTYGVNRTVRVVCGNN